MSSIHLPFEGTGSAISGAASAVAVAVAPRCYILQLPNELLFEILSAAASWEEEIDGTKFGASHATRRALPLVCRHFNRLATPILYSRHNSTLWGIAAQKLDQGDIWTTSSANGGGQELERDSPGAKGVRLLHRTMATNHNLRPLCRDLVFDLIDDHWENDESRQCGNDLIKWFTNTESLRFHDGLDARGNKSTAPSFLATASANMPRLKRLAFTAQSVGLSAERLFDGDLQASIARFSNLRELQIVGLSRRPRPHPHHRNNTARLARLESKAESARGRGQFTELTIQRYRAEQSLLPLILKWPARLTKFTCLGFRQPSQRFEWSVLDLEIVWSALLPHRLSLESIRIGSVCDTREYPEQEDCMWGPQGKVDFTRFESLTSLSLSSWATGTGPNDLESGADLGDWEAGLLAPRLETFEWSFDAEDGRPLFLNDFQQKEEDFLRRFATRAAKQQIPLRKITIVFTPDPAVGAWEDGTYGSSVDATSVRYAVVDLDFEYPWDRMDRLANEFRGLGIELTYNEPPVSRAVSDKVLRRARAMEGAYTAHFDELMYCCVRVLSKLP